MLPSLCYQIIKEGGVVVVVRRGANGGVRAYRAETDLENGHISTQ